MAFNVVMFVIYNRYLCVVS